MSGLNILIALKEKNKNQKWLAEQLDTGEAVISKWINGNVNPGKKSLKKIAKVLDKPISYFFDEEIKNDVDLNSIRPLIGNNVIILPLLADIPAGLPEYSEKDVESFTQVPRYLFPGASFIIKCIGDSMDPEIPKGAFCVIRKETEPLHNRIMLVKTEEGFTIKKVMRVKNKIELHPACKGYKKIIPKELKIIGEVIGTWKRIKPD